MQQNPVHQFNEFQCVWRQGRHALVWEWTKFYAESNNSKGAKSNWLGTLWYSALQDIKLLRFVDFSSMGIYYSIQLIRASGFACTWQSWIGPIQDRLYLYTINRNKRLIYNVILFRKHVHISWPRNQVPHHVRCNEERLGHVWKPSTGGKEWEKCNKCIPTIHVHRRFLARWTIFWEKSGSVLWKTPEEMATRAEGAKRHVEETLFLWYSERFPLQLQYSCKYK